MSFTFNIDIRDRLVISHNTSVPLKCHQTPQLGLFQFSGQQYAIWQVDREWTEGGRMPKNAFSKI